MLFEFMSEFAVQFVIALFISILLSHYIFAKINYIFILISIPLLTILFLLVSHIEFKNIQFDSKKWKASMDLRNNMSDDIIKNKLLIGKTKNEVIDLLGKNFETDGVHADTIFYIIDKNSYGGDPLTLYVKLKNNKVVSVSKIMF